MVRRTIRHVEALEIEYASSLHTDLFYVLRVHELMRVVTYLGQNISVEEGGQHDSLLTSIPGEFSIATLKSRVPRTLVVVGNVSSHGLFTDGSLVDHGHYRFVETGSKVEGNNETQEHHQVENMTT